MPRIISGSARGTRLTAPPGDMTRPTGDRAKEALFSILSPYMQTAGFLDLYAGIGQIGLEAASRGMRPVVLVERARIALQAISANLEKTRLADACAVLAGDVLQVVPRLAAEGRHFSLIYLDPPYRDAQQAFSRLAPSLEQLVVADGLVILEHDSVMRPPSFVTHLQLKRSCQYGTAMISFYQKDNSVENPGNGRQEVPAVRPD